MRIFPRFLSAVGLALACLGTFVGGAIASPFEVVRTYAVTGCDEPSLAKLNAELRYMVAQRGAGAAIRSDLRREGAGFRLASADDVDALAAHG